MFSFSLFFVNSFILFLIFFSFCGNKIRLVSSLINLRMMPRVYGKSTFVFPSHIQNLFFFFFGFFFIVYAFKWNWDGKQIFFIKKEDRKKSYDWGSEMGDRRERKIEFCECIIMNEDALAEVDKNDNGIKFQFLLCVIHFYCCKLLTIRYKINK